MLINNINKIIGITSYSLAYFVRKYLRKYQFELVRNEIDMQAKLKQSILCKNIIRPDSTVECQEEIHSKIAWKWLNCLGYK